MNMSSAFKTAVLAGALLVGTSGGLVGQQPLSGDPPNPKPPGSEPRQERVSGPGAGLPAKSNKASGLIGMEVRNQGGEELGRIRDLVVDLEGERVAYCVMAVSSGGRFFDRQKLHAVPLRAFKPGPDGSHLILNADKAKLAQAEGFNPENWPSVQYPAWGAEPFWREETPAIRPDTKPPGEPERPALPKKDENPEPTPEPTPEPKPQP